VKRVTRPMLGCKSFEAAQDTLVGIALMHMIQKRQMVVEAGEEGLTAAALFSSLAASSPPRQRQLPLHGPLSRMCDRALFSAPSPEPPLIAWGGLPLVHAELAGNHLIKTGLARAYKDQQEEDRDINGFRPVIKPPLEQQTMLGSWYVFLQDVRNGHRHRRHQHGTADQ
jgi:hypothetical protein